MVEYRDQIRCDLFNEMNQRGLSVDLNYLYDLSDEEVEKLLIKYNDKL